MEARPPTEVRKVSEEKEQGQVEKKRLPDDLDELRKKALASRFKDEVNWQDLSHAKVAERAAQGLKAWNVSDVVNERSLNLLMMWKVADGLGIKLSVFVARAEAEIERRIKEQQGE
jgi:hypothetical protein